MESLSSPVNRVYDDAAWFARAVDLRLFTVIVAGELRASALKVLEAAEWHADNRSPWVLLEDASEVPETSWTARSVRLVKAHERRVEAFRKEGIALGLVHPAAESGLQGFIETTKGVLEALRSPLSGLVVILAPTQVLDPWTWERDLGTLVSHPSLAAARWVVVQDAAAGDLGELRQLLDRGAMHCVAEVDEAQRDRDLDALLGASSELFGQAGPRGVTPPRRVDGPPPADAEQVAARDAMLREAGLPPALIGQGGYMLRDKVLRAAVALRRGALDQALHHQRAAVALCAELGLTSAQVVCTIALASYLSAAFRREEAIDELSTAITLADCNALHTAASQAWLALGLLLAVDGRISEARRAYEGAARAAGLGGVPLLEIEAWRMSGQLALGHGDEAGAEQAFIAAIRAAKDADEGVAERSGAVEAARALARLLRGQGMNTVAASLEDQAYAWEQRTSLPSPITLAP